ncbi:MAG: AzlC family ABC transporter permease, partial [Treponema sp.]|nr:AzlC family ABC transporter permease [Treponema sp.]
MNSSGNKKRVFMEGIRDGIPIGIGYFAVAFSLGIVAKNAGLNPFQGFMASALNLASAGEYALFTSIQAGVTYAEVALATLVVNARYFLM